MNRKKTAIKLLFQFLIILIFSMKAYSQKKEIESSSKMKLSKNDSTLLEKTWETFLGTIIAKDKKTTKKMSLKKVYCYIYGNVLPDLSQQQYLPIDSFINSVLNKFYDNRIIQVI